MSMEPSPKWIKGNKEKFNNFCKVEKKQWKNDIKNVSSFFL